VLKPPITVKLKTEINRVIAPYTLSQYVPHNGFLLVGPATAEFEQLLRSAPSVQHVTEYDHTFKISPELSDLAFLSSTTINKGSEDTDAREDDEITLRVLLAPDFSFTKVSDHWKQVFRRIDGTVSMTRDDLALIKISRQHLSTAVRFLAHRREVHWVEQDKRFRIQNKWIKYVIQSDYNVTTVWNHGIRGEGQIIAMGDTGVDWDSCFFYDPNNTVPIGATTINYNHRKIVAYIPIADDRDEPVGHGSHVAGSIAGDALDSPLAPYNGMADKAKLAVYDFKKSNSEELLIPGDLYNYYKDSEKRIGASLTSNSWGSPEGIYDIYCYDSDRYTWEYPNFLPVFAAGNYGEKGFFSVSSPGVAKNVLSVGATKSSSTAFYQQGQESGIRIVAPDALIGDYQVIPAQFGADFRTMAPLDNLPVVAVEPFNACGAITNKEAIKNKIALVVRSGCVFTEKAKKLQDAGAAMMLVMQNDNSPPIVMGATPDIAKGLTIPSGMIAKSLGDRLQDGTAIASYPVDFLSPDLNERTMADFSSRGPTYDGRLKPDVCAPGQFVMSVKSDGVAHPTGSHCSTDDIVAMQGTSMATPITAGAAALVRQYYIDGYYPTGHANSSNGFIPSSALIKATLIASAVPVGGTVQTLGTGSQSHTDTVIPPPSVYQGYGRIQLDEVLAFGEETDKAALYVVNNRTIATGDVHSYCFQVFPDHDQSSPDAPDHSPSIRATLVWNDPPASPASAIALINNLDLFAAIWNTSEVFIGNSHHYGDSTQAPWDVLNNVEQVSIDDTLLGTLPTALISIHVRGTHVPHGNQRYALVITGKFIELPITACAGPVLCPKNCSGAAGWGQCDAEGLCHCIGDYAGPDCSQESQAMIPTDMKNHYFTANGSVQTGLWKWFTFEATNFHLKDGVKVKLTRTAGDGDPDVYIAHNRFPNLNDYDFAGTQCEPCGEHTSVTINSENIKTGKYRIGVY